MPTCLVRVRLSLFQRFGGEDWVAICLANVGGVHLWAGEGVQGAGTDGKLRVMLRPRIRGRLSMDGCLLFWPRF